MSMFVWPDGTVTGSVRVEELEAIQKGLKGVSKKRRESLGPIESADHLADLLAAEGDDSEPEPPKAAKASGSTPKADTKADAEVAEAMSQVDLPAALAKSTKKGT